MEDTISGESCAFIDEGGSPEDTAQSDPREYNDRVEEGQATRADLQPAAFLDTLKDPILFCPHV